MPRSGEPRIVIRLSPEDAAVIEAAASAAGVAVGALVRECAVRHAAEVARDVSAGRVRLRRRSAAVSVSPSPAVPDLSEKINELQPSVTFDPAHRPAVPSVPGVMTAAELMLARQMRLNKGRS